MRAELRRKGILSLLMTKRHDTYANLANEFGVTTRTIQNDIKELMLSYPIKTMAGRYGGGVMMEDWFVSYRQSASPKLSPKQADLLKRLGPQLEGEDREILISILLDFSPIS